MNDFNKTWQRNLSSRASDRVEAQLRHGSENLIIASADDTGVRLNGGRAGARLAPKALINVFKKLTCSSPIREKGIEVQYFDQQADWQNFEDSQRKQSQLFAKSLTTQRQNILHLGGGHDHIYPLLLALQEDQKIKESGLFILNIDAHLDTRKDSIASSGTPFRQWSEIADIPFHLVQIGIHPYANPEGNYQPLKKGKMDIVESHHPYQDLLSTIERLREHGPCPRGQILISLDADAMSASCMKAVSAVNHDGMELSLVKDVFRWGFERSKRRIVGIYEYNPLFDDLSQAGARALCSLINLQYNE